MRIVLTIMTGIKSPHFHCQKHQTQEERKIVWQINIQISQIRRMQQINLNSNNIIEVSINSTRN